MMINNDNDNDNNNNNDNDNINNDDDNDNGPSRRLAAWLPGCLAAWLSGRLDVWLSGRLGVEGAYLWSGTLSDRTERSAARKKSACPSVRLPVRPLIQYDNIL